MAAALLLLLLAWSSSGSAVAASSSWSTQDGENITRAAFAFGQRNADTVAVLPQWTIVSLNAPFVWPNASRTGARPFANGTLMLRGAGPPVLETATPNVTMPSVLDTRMRAGLIPLAPVSFQDLALVNMCWGASTLVGLPFHSATILGIFSASFSVQTISGNRSVVYVPTSALSWIAYGQLVARTCFTTVVDRYGARLLGFLPVLQVFSFTVTAHETFVVRAPSARDPGGIRVWRSIDAPGDPLMSFMRARGMLMEQRWCANGTLVPAELADSPIDPWWGPVYKADSAQEAVARLADATALAAAHHAAQMPIPAVLLYMPTLALPEAALPSSSSSTTGQLRLRAPLLLHGAVGAPAAPVVDLTSRATALFALSQDGKLFASLLTILLPALPLTAEQARTPAVQSALPLTALAAPADAAQQQNQTGVASPWLELDNVTLVVPLPDFLALLTLATDGRAGACVDSSTLTLTAQLQRGVQALTATNATCGSVSLGGYTGWGVNATDLTVRPQQAVPANVCRCLNDLVNGGQQGGGTAGASDASGGGGGGLSGRTVGIIVGCAVGGALLLAALAAGAGLLWRRTKPLPPPPGKDRYWASEDDLEASSSPLGAPIAHGDADPSVAAARDLHAKVKAACAASAQASHSGPSGSASSLGVTPDGRVVLEARLVALLQAHEQQLLQRAGAGSAAPVAGSGGDAGAAAQSLGRAHEQLMSTVASREEQRVEEGAPVVDPRVEVEQVAARLERTHTVVLEALLGRGGGGVVYLGTWRGLPVAVKTMVFEAACEAGGEQGRAAAGQLPYVRAVMETAISASVGHRNVVATYHYDIKRMDDQPDSGGLQVVPGDDASLEVAPQAAVAAGVQAFKVFLVQELCTCSLRMVMERGAIQHNPSAPGTITSLLLHVAWGLEYLHSKGIIHGDLTPANILLKLDQSADGQSTGDQVVAKLADFGLSQRLEAQATHVSNFGAGTPFYVAPEVARLKRTSPASDIFSFGVVAWEVYAGSTPYIVAADGTFARNPRFLHYPPGRQPPSEVHALIKRCLNQEPRERPTASQLVATLLKHDEQQPLGPVA